MIFGFISVSFLLLLAIAVPKRISGIEIYATFFFAYFLGITTDLILDLKYNLYGYYKDGVQITSIIYLISIYFSVSTLFLNHFPYKGILLTKGIYIMAWSVFSIVYESIIVRTNLFYYNGWKLSYSASLYPIIFTILVLNLSFIRKLLMIYIRNAKAP
ncbi:CBO0543 family protein [Bacillus sp. Marseille-P3661]|uniref:CBO0543 family protein n=1 Tax=Bacillus sp. Marseille-P3661 TaxID=1936234 RepID=UPI000C83B3A8|nr:CBO0543 family protein [Bacillus sp. Marseille-P3661]